MAHTLTLGENEERVAAVVLELIRKYAPEEPNRITDIENLVSISLYVLALNMTEKLDPLIVTITAAQMVNDPAGPATQEVIRQFEGWALREHGVVANGRAG